MTSTQENFNARPKPLTRKGQAAHKAIMKVMREKFGGKDPNTGGCRTFYSPKEWAAKGEEYGLKSELIVVYDGGDVGYFFNWDKASEFNSYAWMEAVNAALEPLGLYVETCTGWYSAVYES